MFDPRTDRFPYPENTDEHYLKVEERFHEVFDCDYPYIDRSAPFCRRQAMVRFLLNTVVFPMTRVRLGLRIEGKEHLKAYREEIRKGVISCSNHVHMWDYLAVMCAVRPAKPYVLVWAPNVNGKSGRLVRLVGGIPIPEAGPGVTRVYLKSVEEMIRNGGWLHVYAEGSMWEYYAPIRPFKRGLAHLSETCERPVLPMAFSYRRPGWIRRVLFHQPACFTLRIGEPVSADPQLMGRERLNDLTVRCHDEVCRLAGINPEKNLYPPLFDRSKRIDYYTTEYGIGYRGSR
ncbi:MAG: 1-acyl-sn-glycerol-3-phosphate acyltransferase [Clostridia bacterium]|nr:1-acyl-sn-glycerol-3-phosphate acyltransferase [Clostridia bacterium]